MELQLVFKHKSSEYHWATETLDRGMEDKPHDQLNPSSQISTQLLGLLQEDISELCQYWNPPKFPLRYIYSSRLLSNSSRSYSLSLRSICWAWSSFYICLWEQTHVSSGSYRQGAQKQMLETQLHCWLAGVPIGPLLSSALIEMSEEDEIKCCFQVEPQRAHIGCDRNWPSYNTNKAPIGRKTHRTIYYRC